MKQRNLEVFTFLNSQSLNFNILDKHRKLWCNMKNKIEIYQTIKGVYNMMLT